MSFTRQKYIREKIAATSSVKVIEIAEALNTTPETIRKDLDELEKKGFLRRVHGGAISLDYFKMEESDFDLRSNLQMENKRYIAQNASREIESGSSLFIDNGTTCFEFAKTIIGIHKLKIVTPSLKIASFFQEESSAEVLLLGGWLKKYEPAVFGEYTLSMLRDFHTNKAILSCAGITVNEGLMDIDSDDAAIKRQAIISTDMTLLLADHTKFCSKAFVIVTQIENIGRIYTDTQLPDKIANIFIEKGVDLNR